MQSCIILEPMYVVRKEAQLLAMDLWVGHALDHQKESSGQEQGHISVARCLSGSPMSALMVFAVILIVL